MKSQQRVADTSPTTVYCEDVKFLVDIDVSYAYGQIAFNNKIFTGTIISLVVSCGSRN